MLNTSTQPLITLLTFGLSLLFVGGYLGGEMTRRRYIKEDIKALQQEHARTLARIDSLSQQALLNEKAALAQIDSVYQILGQLNAKEAKSRAAITATGADIERKRKNAAQSQSELIDAARESDFQ